MVARHVVGSGLDRLEEVRGTDDALEASTGVVTVQGSSALIREDEAVIQRLGALTVDRSELVLLGARDGRTYVARQVEPGATAELEEATGGRFENLRHAGARLPPWQAGLLFYAAGLLAWHRTARHCGACGSVTEPARSGHQRVCTNPDCGQVRFPRADPAIITLVRRDDQALLVHQPRWPQGRFSTLAGFVEPGETLEEAVAREVAEEVGLLTERVEYFASQPWPFPHTLMIGFRTEAASGDVALGHELADARWFTREGLRSALSANRITIPDPYALSRSLIEDWLGE